MPSFLAEAYASKRPGATAVFCVQARKVAALDPAVTHVRTAFVPEDETVLHVFRAPSAERLEAACRLAALHVDRLVEIVEGEEIPGEGQHRRY